MKAEAISRPPEDAIAHTHVPVLLVHGTVDRNIPLRHSLRLLAHNPELSLWQVPGADHCGAMSVAPEEFAQKVLAWFELHRKPNVGTLVRAAGGHL